MSHGSVYEPILPPGLTRAEYDAQTRVPLIFAGNITPFVVATIFVVARFWSRQILKGSWAQDDIWVFISWIGSLGHTLLNCSLTFYGIGRHLTVQNEQNAVYMSAGFNILLDLLMVMFAVPRVLPLKLPRLQKAGLITITSLSSLVVVSSVVRLIRISALNSSTDLPWDSFDFTTWSSIEINVGLFCATAPAIRPAIRAMKDALRMNSSPAMSHDTRFPTSMNDGLELEDGPAPALPANSRCWMTKRGRATERELSETDSSKGVLKAISLNRSPESGKARSEAESEAEMGERRVKEGGGTTFFV
ncbi:hypothetical protein V494_04612 [Pseudogymnoascus sp. VKM F-4513 (FW-928)]|nr:hypothetical protein V494_04612 [Pseudogymnoascus sp. VKM F-4513 (FW-928)]